MPDSYPIPNVTPSFTFQNPGIGAVIQDGVAGLLHSMQIKKQLDQGDEELAQREKQLAISSANQQDNALMTREQIAEHAYERKQKQGELKNAIQTQREKKAALGMFNQWLSPAGGGGDFKKLSKFQAQIGDNPVQHDAFNEYVLGWMHQKEAEKALNKPYYAPDRSGSPAEDRPPNKNKWAAQMAPSIQKELYPPGHPQAGYPVYPTYSAALAEGRKRYDQTFNPSATPATPAGPPPTMWQQIAQQQHGGAPQQPAPQAPVKPTINAADRKALKADGMTDEEIRAQFDFKP